MAGKKIAEYTVGVGFQVDPKGLQQAFKDLKSINYTDMMNIKPHLNGDQLRAEMDKIRKLATATENALIQSFNPKLNTYSFKAFNEELQKSGRSAQLVVDEFSQLGSKGQAALAQMAKTLMTTNVQLKEAHSWLDKMGTTIANTVRWQAATKVIQSMTGAIQQGYYFTKDLDKSLNDIRIVTDKSAASMDKFAQKASAAAKELGKSTTDYTNASLIFYQQGLTDKEVEARTETTLKASNVTGQSASAVSQELTAVWNGYQIGVEKTEEAVDKLAAVAATSASNLEELSTAMSKVAATANMTGVDIDQLNAQISTIISVTRQAPETVGTALKTIYARISDLKLGGTDEDGLGLGDVSGTLHDLGIEVLDSTGNLRDMGTVIEEIAEKWNYLTRAERTALAEVMGGKRQYTNLVALFDNWDKYTKALDISRNSLGTLQKQQDIFMDSTKAHLQQLNTAKEQLYAAIWDDDTIKKGSDALRSMVESVTRIITVLGGGKGLIANVISLGTMFASKQIGQGIATFVNNFNAMTQNANAIKEITNNARQFATLLNGNKQTSQVEAYASQTAQAYQNFNLGLISKDELESQIQFLDNQIQKQIELNAILEKNQLTEQKFADAMDAVGTKAEFSTTNMDENRDAVKTVVQQLQEEVNVYKQLDDVLNHNNEATTENITVSNKLTDTQKERVNNLKNEVIEIEKEEKALNKYKEQLGALKAAAESYEKGNTKRSVVVQAFGAMGEKTPKANKDLYEKIKKIEKDYTDASNKLAERRANAQKQSSELSQDAIEAQKKASELSLQDYKDISADLVEQQSRTFSEIQANKQLITQSLSQGIAGTVTGIANLGVQVSNLSNAFSGLINEEMTFGDFIKTMLINLPLLASSYNKVSQSLGLLTNAQKIKIQNDALSVAYDKQKEVTTKSLNLLEKAENGIKIENAEVSALSAAMTKADAEAKAAEAASSEAASGAIAKLNAVLAAHKIAILGAVAAAALLVGIYKSIQKSEQKAAEATAEAAQKDFEASKQKSNASKEEADNVEKINKAYRDLLKTAEEEKYSKEQLEDATKSLLEQYNQEELYLDVLTGKYLDYKDAIKGVTEEKEKQALEEANQTKDKAITSMSSVVASTHLQKNYTEFLGKAGLSDAQQESFASILGLSLDEFRGIDSKKLAELISQNRDRVQTFYSHQLSATGTDSKFTDALGKYLEETQEEQETLEEIDKEITDIESRQKLRDIFNNAELSSEDRLKQIEKIANKTDTSASSIYADYSSVEQYNRDVLENSDYAKQLGLNVNQLSDEEVKNYMQTMQNSTKLTKEQTDTLIKAKNTYDDYTKSVEEATIAIKGLADWDFTTRIGDESILKQALGLDDEENIPKEFEDYLKSIGTDLDSFYKYYSQDAQDNILRNYAQSTREQAEQDLEVAKKAQEELENKKDEVESNLRQSRNLEDRTKIWLDNAKEKAMQEAQEAAQATIQSFGSAEFFANAWSPNELEEISNILTKNVSDLTDVEKEIITDINKSFNNTIDTTNVDRLQKKYDEAKKLREEYEKSFHSLEEQYKKAIESLEPLDYKAFYSSFIKELKEANQEIDNLQSAYSSLTDVVETYNETGELSLDQAQQLATMDGQYLAALEMTENGLTVNTEKLEELTRAQVEKAKMDIVSAADAEIHEIATNGVSYALAEASLAASLYNNELAGTPEKTQAAIEATNSYIQSLRGLSLEQRNAIDQVIADRDRRLKIYDNVGLTSGNLLDSGKKAKEKSKYLVEAELDIYHDINIELKKIEREIDRINDKREKLLGQDLYNSYSQELAALEAQEDALKRLQDLQKKDAADKRAELAANGVMFDANGEVSNYNAIKQKWADQVNANPDNEALSKRRDELEELLSGYEELWDEKIPDTVDKLTDVANAKIEAAVNRFNLHMDVTLDLTEMKRAFNEFRRDFIDKTRSDDFSKFIETLTENMKLSYKAMDENVKHVNEIQAEIEKIRAGQNSQIYGDNLAKAVEDLENYNEKLKDEMKSVTEDLTSANEKYAESIDKLTEAYAKQQEYLEKLSQNYEDNAKLMQLLYGENRASSSVAGMLDQQANVLATSAQKYRAEADRYEAEIAKIQAQLADGNLTTETRQALEEEFQTLQDAALEAINNAASASVAAIEKANEAFEATVKGSTYDMATKLLGEDFDIFKADWEATQHYAELYYDDINKAFEVQKLSNKYQKTLNELTGTAHAKLREAYDAELVHLREKDKLTKYDIERAQKKYDLLVAQIALEEAQQNKNTLQLVRDSQGNYNYQYTADASAVADAQEKVDNLQQELYNLDQEAWKDNTESIMNEIETVAEKVTESYERQRQKIKQVQDNANLSEEEKFNKIKEITDAETVIRDNYYNKLNALITERKDIAIHAEEDTKDAIELLDLKYLENFETETMPRLFHKWEDTEKLIEEEDARVTDNIINSQNEIATANDNLTKLIVDNGAKAADAYQKIDDKIQKVLIPTQDAYIKKMDEEVTETAKVAKAIEELAQNYQKLYGDAGTAAEKTNALIELCKQFQELPNKTVTNTVKNVTINETKDVGNGIAKFAGGLGGFGEKLKPEENSDDNKGLQTITVSKNVANSNAATASSTNISGDEFTYVLGTDTTYAAIARAYRDVRYLSDWVNSMTKYSSNNPKGYVQVKDADDKIVGYMGYGDFVYQFIKQHQELADYKLQITDALVKKRIPSAVTFDTGGYTGKWDSTGRLAVLHQKELVLNSVDTANLLETIKYQREISQMQMAAAATSEKTPSTMTANGQLDQNVYIEASFPGVQNANEIEAALNNLVNAAAQRANSNLL